MDAIESTVVLDRNGVELYEALGGDGTRASQLRAENIPAIVAAATVAAEDRRFWSHHGIDPIAVLRAIKQNVVGRLHRRGRLDDHTAGRQAAAAAPGRRSTARLANEAS